MTITMHSAQAAALAREAGERPEVVAAALLHDVGHMLGFEAGLPAQMDGCGFEAHDTAGADFLLDLGFHRDVAFLTSQHVAAKRYLVSVDEKYNAKLSTASRTTLGFQGGPMSAEEIAVCDADARWPEVLRLRSYDEAAKETEIFKGWSASQVLDEFEMELSASIPPIDFSNCSPSPFVETFVLSPEQLRKWDQDGMLLVRGALTEDVTAALPDMVNRLINDHDRGGKDTSLATEVPFDCRLVHRELVDGRAQVCRVENFAKHDANWKALVDGVVQDIVSQVYREPAVLFKDKINFKGPGGGSFLPHQDATAYATDEFASHHVSVLVAVDEATVSNGALMVVPGAHRRGVLPNQNGVIDTDVEAELVYEHVLVEPGDIVLFDSFLPHKSEKNFTDTWRRSGYFTFNKFSEGDFHRRYYEKKAEVMEQGAISINKDFGGMIVD